MRQIRVVLRRLRALFGGTPDDRDLENEIESHLQLHVDDNLRAGMTLDEARRRALVRLGGVESVKRPIAIAAAFRCWKPRCRTPATPFGRYGEIVARRWSAFS